MSARSWFWAAALGYAAVLGWAWTVLPDRVPVHWSGSGGPDRVVGRDRAVLEFALLGGVTTAMFAGLAAWMRKVPLGLVNVPHKDHWSRTENQPELRRRVAADMWAFGAGMQAFLAVVVVQIVLVADEPEPRLGPVFVVALIAVVVLSVGYVLAASLWRYRPDQDST